MDIKPLNVVKYLLGRLKYYGVKDVFGVAGDYNFCILDEIERIKELRYYGCSNELVAGYAADGYARIKGLSVLATTFSVGSLSASNAIAGAYAEDVPLIHIVGAPAFNVLEKNNFLHHTLLTHDVSYHEKIFDLLSEASTVLTKENAKYEIERVIRVAIEKKKPVYIQLAADVAIEPLANDSVPVTKENITDENLIEKVAGIIASKINQAKNPVCLVDWRAMRYKAADTIVRLSEKAGIPMVELVGGKGALPEQHPNYIGVYTGSLINTETQAIVEASDCIVLVGVVWTEANAAFGTVALKQEHLVRIDGGQARIDGIWYENLDMLNVLRKVLAKVESRHYKIPGIKGAYDKLPPELDVPLHSAYYYARLERFFKDGDLIVSDMGTTSAGLLQVNLPDGVSYVNQGIYASIGYATGAALGVGLADKSRRLILLTGDGAHQMTAQAVGDMVRYGLKPIVLVVNNHGYTIERVIAQPYNFTYNDIPAWNYTDIPKAFGAVEYFSVRVTTNREFDEALKRAQAECRIHICYIEVVMDEFDEPPYLAALVRGLKKMGK